MMTNYYWCSKKSLVYEQPSVVMLTHYPFWVRIKILPFNCRSSPICKVIASNLGLIMDVHEDDTINLDNFQRARVIMDISKLYVRF